MEFFQVTLLLATFLCSLVAGFLFAFAVVAMPGIKKLSSGAFIRAFQVMDGVIQNNQPVFMLVWGGSVIALIVATVLGFWQLEGVDRILIAGAMLIYLFGVQLPTIIINVPLNNQLQTLDVDTMDDPALKAARMAFEPRWNHWNVIRTVISSVVSVMLIVLVFRI